MAQGTQMKPTFTFPWPTCLAVDSALRELAVRAIASSSSTDNSAAEISLSDCTLKIEAAVAAALAAAPQPPAVGAGGWQPMATAPRDGTWFDAYFHARPGEEDDYAVAGVDTIRWSGKGFWWSRAVAASYPEKRPDAWKLPAPPSAPTAPETESER